MVGPAPEVYTVHPTGLPHRTTEDVIWASTLRTICRPQGNLTSAGRKSTAFLLELR